MSYENEINKSVENLIFQKNEIYQFIETPYEQQFESFYVFCRKNLDINSEKYSLNPNLIIYLNDYSVNAKAGIKNNHFVIAINTGLMVCSIQNILLNESFHNFINEKFPSLLDYFDNSLEVLSFQLSTQFTYYHELGHLIQFTTFNGDVCLNERIEPNDEFDINKHWLEFNADTFSSISIASHIQQYLFKQIGEDLNSEISSNCLKIFGTCLFSYVTSFATTSENLYFFEKSHPHPIIRVLNILMSIIHYLNQSPKFIEKNITFSYKDIIESIISLHKSLEEKNIMNNNISNHITESLDRASEIINYNKILREILPENFKDAVVEWNKNIT